MTKTKKVIASVVVLGILGASSQVPIVDKVIKANRVQITQNDGISVRLPDGTCRSASIAEWNSWAVKDGVVAPGVARRGTQFDTPCGDIRFADVYTENNEEVISLGYRILREKDFPSTISYDKNTNEIKTYKKVLDLFVPGAEAAITLDTTTSTEASPTTAITIPMTVGSGSNQLIVGHLVSFGNSRTPTTVTWNLGALTQDVIGDGNNISASIWSRVNPDTGAHNFIASYTGLADGASVGVSSVFGAAQTNTLNVTSTATYNTVVSVTSTKTTTADQTWAFDANGDQNAAMIPGTGQTKIGTVCSDTCTFSYKQDIAIGTSSLNWHWTGNEDGQVSTAWYAPVAAAGSVPKKKINPPPIINQ